MGESAWRKEFGCCATLSKTSSAFKDKQNESQGDETAMTYLCNTCRPSDQRVKIPYTTTDIGQMR